MGDRARMVIPVTFLDFLSLRGSQPPRVDIRLETSELGGRFLMENWGKPGRFAELALIEEPAQSAIYRARCMGCGHFDNELPLVTRDCVRYGRNGHHMVLVDNEGVPTVPITHVPTLAPVGRR